MAQIFEIEISDGITSKTRKLRKGMTIEKAMDVFTKLCYEDYMGWTYTLLVDGEVYLTNED